MGITKQKNKNKLILGGIFVVSVGIVCSLVFLGRIFEGLQININSYTAARIASESQQMEQNLLTVKEDVDAEKEKTKDNKVVLSTNNASVIQGFWVGESYYTIPSTFQDFTNDGWTQQLIMDSDKSRVLGVGKSRYLSLTKLVNGEADLFLNITVNNPTSQVILMKQAIVSDFIVFDERIEFSSGISVGMTKMELTDLMGEASGVARFETSYQHAYLSEEENNQELYVQEIYIFVNGNTHDSKVTYIQVRNSIIPDPYTLQNDLD